MYFKLINKHVPIRLTYLNSKRREVTVYATFSSPTIYVGEDRYFLALDDKTQLIKSNRGNGIRVGTVIDFEYLEIGE